MLFVTFYKKVTKISTSFKNILALEISSNSKLGSVINFIDSQGGILGVLAISIK
jgi:hypothetical protein